MSAVQQARWAPAELITSPIRRQQSVSTRILPCAAASSSFAAPSVLSNTAAGASATVTATAYTTGKKTAAPLSTSINAAPPSHAISEMDSLSPQESVNAAAPATAATAASTASVSSSQAVSPARRPIRPMLSRLDTSERIKAYDAVSTARAAVKARNQGHALTLDIESASRQTSRSNSTQASCASSSSCNTSISGGGSGSGPSSSASAAHLHSFVTAAETGQSPSRLANYTASTRLHDLPENLGNETGFGFARRRDTEPFDPFGKNFTSAMATSMRTPITPSRAVSLSSSATMTAPFDPSEILDDFLYVGPEITTKSEAAFLRDQLGVKRILNAAWEIENGGGKQLSLDDESESGFKRYLKLPLKDTVEAKDVQFYIEEACAFLDDARLHSAPTYVHCKAGKSRSAMLVMAYLIHSKRWSLQRAYAYVVERRRDVSPNVGFVAELMAFEEKRLGARPGRVGANVRSSTLSVDDAEGVPIAAAEKDRSEVRHSAGPILSPLRDSYLIKEEQQRQTPSASLSSFIRRPLDEEPETAKPQATFFSSLESTGQLTDEPLSEEDSYAEIRHSLS